MKKEEKCFTELEQFFERFKSSLPSNLDKTPPKRKFLVSEQEIIEKRKNWVEAIINYLINKYFKNSDIQLFFGPLINLFDDNYIYLGNSEKRSIKPSHFDYLKTIGQGSFGRVYMEQIKRRNEVKHVMAEKNVFLKNINHPFLVSLHYSFQTKNKLYFVLDFLNGGELFFHLQKEPPEVIEKKPYDRTVDWWCLGCVLFEMLFGLPPFYSKNQQEMYQKIINQQLIIPSNISLSARNFLQRILRKNRFERLGAKNFDV
uniref:Protein kinase domain-containing protein n=1 Tax=Meloidogyne floridensis TaxID=298350 RepID=A0A915PHI1_9BILA